MVEFEYEAGVYDASRPVRRVRLHPYAIEPSAATRALYVIGWDEERSARRTYKVERIRSISVTPESYEAPDASVARTLAAWDVIGDSDAVEVVIRFVPGRLNAYTRPAGTTARSRSSRTMAHCCGAPEWRACSRSAHGCLGWGPDAEVLEPPELREWVASRHAEAAARYSE